MLIKTRANEKPKVKPLQKNADDYFCTIHNKQRAISFFLSLCIFSSPFPLISVLSFPTEEMPLKKRVAVLGAGVVGLSSAVNIQVTIAHYIY